MELFPAEAETLKKIVSEWHEHPERELEATFGIRGEVGATEFLTVAKRLKAKGYTALPQEDRLTITTPDHSRFTLNGLGVIQQYCRDNRLAGKPFVAMIKDRAGVESNLDLDDYDTRIKVRREIPLSADDGRVKELLATWPQQKKAFRLIRRWTFQGNGVLFDLSMVRSTKQDLKGNFVWVRNFADQNILGAPPTYEIEVELVRGDATSTPEKALASAIRGIGEVLRGLQKHTLLVRKSVKIKTINAYKTLVGDDKFRGVAPVTLEMKNMTKDKEPGTPNIRDGYNVTDKADGLRVLGFCDSKGELFMIDMAMNVYKTGLRRDICHDSLVDGEFVTMTKDGKAIQQLLLFDIYIAPEAKKVDGLPFYKFQADTPSRFASLKAWTDAWNSGDGAKVLATGITPQNRLQVSPKNFFFAPPGDTQIFQLSSQILSRPTIYNTDGLIFTPNDLPLPSKSGVGFLEQFKWKPSEDNTIDFLVMTQKSIDSFGLASKLDMVTTSIKPESNDTIRYKTLRLYVGSSTEAAYANPRDTLLFERGLPTGQRKGGRGGEYKPVTFNPKDFPDTMASVCHIEIQTDPDTNEEFIMTERSSEPIQDKSIVEMRYDVSAPIGWRWKPIRVRYDKTERLQRGILARTLNSEKVAESVWNSIHDPITETMIRTGAEEPSEAEMATMAHAGEERAGVGRKYYERKAPQQDLMIVRGLRDFHNKWVKERVLLAAGLKGGNKSLLDVAVGKAADLQKWRRNGVGFVLGVDYSGENIRDPENGAYRRYLDTLVNARGAAIPPMIFAIGDSSKPLVNGAAGITEEEGDILRGVFGKVNPVGPIPSYISKMGLGKLKDGADCMACMFALHYFFKDQGTFNGFLENIRDTLKVGGYFVACFFDGDKVFELLDNVEMGESKSGKVNDAEIWSITKQYDLDEMPNDDSGFGLAIDVEFISIGTSHREYLVPFKLLVDKMRTIGCELLTESEAKEVGLKNSTNMFDETYKMATAAGQKYVMNEVVSQYSFLNRWVIFKRKGSAGVNTEIKELEMESAASVLKPGLAPPISTELAYSAATNMRTLADAVAVASTKTVGPTKKKNIQVQPPPLPLPAAAAEGPKPGSILAAVEEPQKIYSVNDVFLFYHDAGLQDKLKIGDKAAGRWLALYAPFPIQDPTEPGTKYPSMEHFLAAMRYKLATDQPQLASSLFSEEGTIHQKFLRDRLAASAGGRKPLTEEQDQEFLKQEMTEVRFATRPGNIKKYKAVLDEAKWASQRDSILREGLRQRWERDARLRKIVEAARAQGKYLLYYTGATVVGDLGGVRRTDGKIEGENKVGRTLMELAGFV